MSFINYETPLEPIEQKQISDWTEIAEVLNIFRIGFPKGFLEMYGNPNGPFARL